MFKIKIIPVYIHYKTVLIVLLVKIKNCVENSFKNGICEVTDKNAITSAFHFYSKPAKYTKNSFK